MIYTDTRYNLMQRFNLEHTTILPRSYNLERLIKKPISEHLSRYKPIGPTMLVEWNES